MNCKQKQLLVVIVFAVGIVLAIADRSIRVKSFMLSVIAVVILIAGVVLEILLFRCPHCGPIWADILSPENTALSAVKKSIKGRIIWAFLTN